MNDFVNFRTAYAAKRENSQTPKQQSKVSFDEEHGGSLESKRGYAMRCLSGTGKRVMRGDGIMENVAGQKCLLSFLQAHLRVQIQPSHSRDRYFDERRPPPTLRLSAGRALRGKALNLQMRPIPGCRSFSPVGRDFKTSPCSPLRP